MYVCMYVCRVIAESTWNYEGCFHLRLCRSGICWKSEHLALSPVSQRPCLERGMCVCMCVCIMYVCIYILTMLVVTPTDLFLLTKGIAT